MSLPSDYDLAVKVTERQYEQETLDQCMLTSCVASLSELGTIYLQHATLYFLVYMCVWTKTYLLSFVNPYSGVTSLSELGTVCLKLFLYSKSKQITWLY